MTTSKTLFRRRRRAAGKKPARENRREFELLEPRLVLQAGPLVINEFMAINQGFRADGDGTFSDWIEIHNPTENQISLDGWYLTDDDDPTKWPFPDEPIAPGGYRLVFASDQSVDNYVDPQGYSHTNFALDGGGEYLALTFDDGSTIQIAHQFETEYPQQVRDISYGLSPDETVVETLVSAGAAARYHVPIAGEDVLDWTALTYDDSGWVDSFVTDSAGLVIGEIETGDTDWVEIQNVSDEAIDTDGWFVVLNDASSGNINDVHAVVWDLTGPSIAPGQLRYRTDATGDEYWGSDISWEPGQSGWAMIVDDGGNVVDFLAWGYTEAEIATLNISAGGFGSITVGSRWSGDGAETGDGTGGGDPGPEEDVIPFGSVWNYLHPTDATNPADSDPDFDNTWMTADGYDGPAFDDSGAGLLGYGTINYQAVATNIGQPDRGDRYTAYFRREFTLTEHMVDAGIELLSDDGGVVYIDGVEATRSNFIGLDTYFAFARHHQHPDGTSTESRTITLPIADLEPGTHTIAVSMHQNSATSSDIGFALRMFGRPDGGLGSALERTGNTDGDTAADFDATREPSKGTLNPDLTVPFGTELDVTTGIGFSSDPQSPLQTLIRTNVAEAMQAAADPNASLWSRIEFSVVEASMFDQLTLWMKYDDGFVAYLNGTPIAWRNAPDPLVFDSSATAARQDEQVVVFEEIDVSEYLFDSLQTGTNVLAIHGLNYSPGDGDFLILPELVATSNLDDPQYMTTPTPGQPNVAGALGLVADTKFSQDRGFYRAPFDVEITTKTPGAEIRYTVDGSKPTETTGTVYTDPIHVTTTTTIRAAAFRPGYLSANVDTHTYIFSNDVAVQTRPAGYPSWWGGESNADYDVDQNVSMSQQYNSRFIQGLTAVPTLSLVLPMEDFFGSGGLYSNTGSRSLEKEASAELIYADGTKGFQIEAGLKIQGGASRSVEAAIKHSMSLRFRQVYGAGRLDFPMFDDSPVNSFDALHLRANYNNSWIHRDQGQRNRGSMIRDQWMRDSLLQMGQEDAGRGDYVNVYVNGLYWGLYMIHERQEASHYADYNGGAEEDYDAIKNGSATDGNTSSWNALHSFVDSTISGGITLAEFQQIQQRLDIVSLIDYMIVNIYGANADWDHHNWRAAGGGTANAPWKIYNWDAERVLEGVGSNNAGENNGGSPSRLYHNLRTYSEEFRLLFADRLHKHFHNGGALTPENTAARWMRRAGQIDTAIVGESARWGDDRPGGPYYRDNQWITEQYRLIGEYFPYRSDNVFNKFDDLSPSLYPDTAAPVFRINGSNQHGGPVGQGDLLTMQFGSGTVYYTLDGTDPRLPGGAINWGSAHVYSGQSIPMEESALIRARAQSGSEWSAINEAEFFVGPQATAENLVITEINYNPYEPPEDDDTYTNEDFEFIELQNIGQHTIDLSGVRFADGITFDFAGSDVTELGSGDIVVVARDPDALDLRYSAAADFLVGPYGGQLDNNGEQIELLDWKGDPIVDFRYNDGGGWPGRADGHGSSLELIDPAAVPQTEPERTDFLEDDDNWRSSTEYGGSPGHEGTGPIADVVINEILSHTDAPLSDSIELHNTTDDAIVIGDWYLSDSNNNYRQFRIPPGTSIPAGGYRVFDEGDFNPTPLDPGPNDFALDGAHGDEVWLVEANAAGNLVRFADHVEFGAAVNGESFGRWPNGTGELYPMTDRTLDPAGANSGPRVGPVVISEVHYNHDWRDDSDPNDPEAPPDDDFLEFVEIYNPTASTVELTNWRIRKGIDFDFPGGTQLDSGEALVVVRFDPADADLLAAFYDAHGIDYSVKILGAYSGRLSNTGERVQLQRPDEPPQDEPGFYPRLLEDEVRYSDVSPWPGEADGDGESLNRVGSNHWGNDPTSWIASDPTPGVTPLLVAATVGGRHVFYNNSYFDVQSDGNAVAGDKQALLPGGTATFANYTSYDKGINGVMVDIFDLGGNTPRLADFQFRAGTDDTPDDWADAPASSITVHPGQGVDDSDRVKIIFNDSTIVNQWLQVTVLASGNTNLAVDDVFYFGNALAESGNSAGDARVNATDVLLTRNNPRNLLNPAPADFRYDFNRDKRVNAADMLIARNNQTHMLDALPLITVPVGKAATVEIATVEIATVEIATVEIAAVKAAAVEEAFAQDALAWLYEYEQLGAGDRATANDKTADSPEELLADY